MERVSAIAGDLVSAAGRAANCRSRDVARSRRSPEACARISAVSVPTESRFSLVGVAGASGALRLLFWLRMVAIASQLVAIAFVEYALDTSLPLRELGLTIGSLALWNVLNYGAVHANRRVSDAEVALHLAVDIIALTSVLYFTGGSTNPFVSLYLVPISLAATSLPTAYAWLVGARCSASSPSARRGRDRMSEWALRCASLAPMV